MAQTSDKQPAAGKASAKAARVSVRAAGPEASPETESLLGLIDKLSALLEKSELAEIEVEAGETGIVLRKPSAVATSVVAVAAAEHSALSASTAAAPAAPAEPPAPASTARVVKAPLTGVFYSASSPTSPPYVTAGQHVAVGQVIGLIEAMKLFNEIKSDVSGRVVRVVAESGKLVKAKQPLIEVEP